MSKFSRRYKWSQDVNICKKEFALHVKFYLAFKEKQHLTVPLVSLGPVLLVLIQYTPK